MPAGELQLGLIEEEGEALALAQLVALTRVEIRASHA